MLQKEGEGPVLARCAGDGRRIVRAIVDSGAEDTVFPPGCVPGQPEPSPMSISGATYRAANGAPIRNLGQQTAKFVDEKGRRCALPTQIAEVEKPLVSVRHLTEAGNCVSFGANGGEIRHLSSGKVLPLKKVGKVYYLEMHLDTEQQQRQQQQQQQAKEKEEQLQHPDARGEARGFARPGNQ